MGVSPNLNFGSAADSGTQAIAWDKTALGFNTAAPVVAGFGDFEAGNYRAQVAANNAQIMRQNAGAAQAAGSYAESAEKLKTGELIGQQKAVQGANGIDVGVGSPKAVRSSTQTIGDMDAAMIHFNAARQAFNDETQANNFAAQSKLDKMGAQGALIAGVGKAGSTFLSGASGLSSKWAQFRLAGLDG